VREALYSHFASKEAMMAAAIEAAFAEKLDDIERLGQTES